MKYINNKTGFVIETDAVIKGENWEAVKPSPSSKPVKENKPVKKEK